MQENYGIDWDGPVPDVNADDESVQVPDIHCLISRESEAYLESVYTQDVILASDSHAVDIYISVRDYVYSHLAH